MANNNIVRLQKYMADCGVASRRKSEELIANGKVKVNGHVSKLGDKVNIKKDIVTVRGKRISNNSSKHYIALYKPRGYVTTVSDNLDRKTVMDLVKDVDDRIYPVGRLDKDSEGLLLLTNDGEFSNLLMHPSHELSKVYRVTVRQKVTDEIIDNLRQGVIIEDRKTAPCEVVTILEEENRTVLEFIIHEGRNRQIRKMCETQNLTVIRLKRIAIGSLKLGHLTPGKWRELTDNEVEKLLKSSGVVVKELKK